MCKSMIVKKISLGSNFPRAILHARQNAIGMGLIKLKMILSMLACKFHIRNIRSKTRINKLIQYHKQAIMIEYGYREMKR